MGASPPTPASAVSAVVVAPTHNNDRTLTDVLERVAATGFPLIVVNDGCTDRTPELLRAYRGTHPQARLTVLEHPSRRGKAAALLTGFAEAERQGYSHAVTIDTDGQLDPEQIPDLVSAAESNPSALVLGARDDTQPDYPPRSRIGRRLSNFAIRLACGERVNDSQCGFRVYPLALLRGAQCRARHYGWEAEIITRAAWARHALVNVPVRCRYFPAATRVSHFDPWRETLRGIALHGRLILRRLLPLPRRSKSAVMPPDPS